MMSKMPGEMQLLSPNTGARHRGCRAVATAMYSNKHRAADEFLRTHKTLIFSAIFVPPRPFLDLFLEIIRLYNRI
jgi:hypothetical protein